MKFFTREWLTGELTDEECNGIVSAYNRHLQSILPRLTHNLLDFVKTVNLHDGLIRRIVVDYTQLMLGLYLRCGDLQQGYYDLDIRYKDIQAGKVVVDTLAAVVQNSNTEILYDELDVTNDNKFIHRMIFDPYYEISIIFRELEYEQIKQSNRDFPIATKKFDIIR